MPGIGNLTQLNTHNKNFQQSNTNASSLKSECSAYQPFVYDVVVCYAGTDSGKFVPLNEHQSDKKI